MKIRDVIFRVDERKRESGLLSKVEDILDKSLIPAQGVIKRPAIMKFLAEELGYDLSDRSKREFWALIEKKYPYQTVIHFGHHCLKGKKLKMTDSGFIAKGTSWKGAKDRINKRIKAHDKKTKRNDD